MQGTTSGKKISFICLFYALNFYDTVSKGKTISEGENGKNVEEGLA